MTLQPKCLIVDKMHESIITLLEQQGFTVHYKPEITRQEMFQVISEYTGILIRSKTEVDAPLIEAASSLKFVGRAGAGVDQLDVDLLEARSIAVLNAPEGNRDALGEHTVGMLLGLLNKINLGDRQIRKGVWNREGNRGTEIMGKTVGLIGFGNMGKAFASRLACFGCRILAYDKYLTHYKTNYAEEASLGDIYRESDVLSIHVPLTAETRGMINKEFIENFHRPFYFLNTARGEISPFKVINEALKEGKMLGAALDVLENEKIQQLTPSQKKDFEEMVRSKELSSPPCGGIVPFESYEKISVVLAEKIRDLYLTSQ